MTDPEDGATVDNSNDDVISVQHEDGSSTIYARVAPDVAASAVAQLRAQKVPVAEKSMGIGDFSELLGSFVEGQVASPRPRRSASPFRSPRLSVPADFYTRVRWSEEYYEQEPLVNALVDRDINQAIKRVEFQFNEDHASGKDAKMALERWSTILNRDIQQTDGLHGYNKDTALECALSGLVVCIANWGPVEIKGQIFRLPLVIQNLDPELLVPDIDLFTGKRIYYYKLSASLAKELKMSRRRDNAWRQMIPQLGSAIVDALPANLRDRYKREISDGGDWFSGPFLKIPEELVYAINFGARPKQRFPKPSLTSIFSALAMKRKLQLADWAVADGMINMLMVWSFPAGSDAEVAKGIVRTAAEGGRVQSISIPAQVKVELITPPTEILNSADKFWIPWSEILAHFDFLLNSKSRGAGDLDSGSLDLAANIARLGTYRDEIEALDNFWLERIADENHWGDLNPTVLLPKIDLTNSDAFRAFILSLYDRGSLSEETTLDAAGTTVEREVARRKREKASGIEDDLEIRPSFSQTTGVPGDGRTPDAEAKPRGGANPNRPPSSSQSESRT